MEEKERLIRQLDEAREAMRAVLADIDPTLEVYPTWTIKHVLAHITGWDDACISSLRAHAGGNEPPTPAVEGINAYNAQSVATRQALDYRQVVKEWEAARAQLKTVLNEMPPDKFQEPLLFPWGPRGKIARLIAIFAGHEKEHAQEIQELKAKSAH
jgi:uncharacterized protein (TIGR03083 family)